MAETNVLAPVPAPVSVPAPVPAQNTKPDQTPTPSSLNRIIFSLTTISFLLSFPVIFCVVWLLYVRQGTCEHVLPLAKLQLGVIIGLIVLFVISNGVVFLRSRFLMMGLVVVMVPLIVILTVSSALMGAYTVESRLIPGSPSWFKMMVNNDTNWSVIESCIYETRTCHELALQSSEIRSYDFSRKHLSPIESGCCVPPSICEMKYVNATYWKKKNDVSYGPYDIDCDMWQNKVTKLCYECYSCRKGYIKTLRRKWHKLGVFLVVVTILLIVSHLLLFVASMWLRYAS